jgi:hypothetical protein
MLATISGGGALTFKNIADINANFAAVQVPDIWVRPQYGNDSTGDGSYAKPFATMSGTARVLAAGMVVGIEGVLFEEYTGPIIGDVTLLGMANQPRQATTSGAPNGGGATWLSPSGGTGNLLTIQGQGWRVENVFFNNTATGSTTADVVLSRAGDPPTAADASHAAFVGCKFTGGNYGIRDDGGAGFVLIDGCTFFNFVGSGDTAIKSTSTSQANPLQWHVRNSYFFNNVNHIVTPLVGATLTGNTIMVKGSTVATTTTAVDFTGGSSNVVMANNLGDNASGAAATWTGGTNDMWCNLTADDGMASGVPA